MSGEALRARSKLLLGALAGIVGTAAMTIAMSRLHRRLPGPERYPLPPREIVQVLAHIEDEATIKDTTLAAHFAFGAAGGAALAALRASPSPAGGAAFGVVIWAGSYLGWIPAAGILRPAIEHPKRRNALMLVAHIVWGATAALSLCELRLARRTLLRAGPLLDATPKG